MNSLRTGPPSRLLVFAVTAMALLNNSVLMSSTPEILESFGEPIERAGMLIAAGTVIGIVAAPAIGFLADRYGRKRVLVPCLLVFGVFGSLGGFSPSFRWLLAVRVIQGLGSAGLINLVVVLITDHWSGSERTRLLGQNSAVITAFLAVFPFLGGATTDLFGWRWNFAYYGLALVVGAVVVRSLHDPWEGRTDPVGRQLRDALVELSVPVNAIAIVLGSLIFFVNVRGVSNPHSNSPRRGVRAWTDETGNRGCRPRRDLHSHRAGCDLVPGSDVDQGHVGRGPRGVRRDLCGYGTRKPLATGCRGRRLRPG